MDNISDRRLFLLSLTAAIVGFAVWAALLRPASGSWILVVAIVVFAVLAFVDGYLASGQPGQ